MKSGIYVITNNKNLKCYVGSSVNVGRRLKDHKRGLKSNYHPNNHLQNAWNKYGEEAFVFEQVEECPVDQLLVREQFWLDDMRTAELGYNLSPTAGNILGFKHSEDTKQKLSQIKTGTTHSEESRQKMSESRKGEKHHLYGKTHSPEARQKISEARKGKPLSLEHRQKMSEARKGKTHSEESRQKMSENNRGENHPFYGKNHSPETIQKMSETKRGDRNPFFGKSHSPETRKKISETKKNKRNQ